MKGFIVIDGFLLIVGEVDFEGLFWLYLIFEMLCFMNFGDKGFGVRVNVEFEVCIVMIVDMVECIFG